MEVRLPTDDPEAVANAISCLLSNPARMKAMGAQGRERLEKYFTWDKVAQRVVDGYHRIL